MSATHVNCYNFAAIHCSFVAAMNVPGGGKNDIPNRLKRHFAVFYVPPPSDAAINSMFGALMRVCSSSVLAKIVIPL